MDEGNSQYYNAHSLDQGCPTLNHQVAAMYVLQVPTHKPHYDTNIYSQYTNINICPAMMRSMKHKHTNKNWTHKAQNNTLVLKNHPL